MHMYLASSNDIQSPVNPSSSRMRIGRRSSCAVQPCRFEGNLAVTDEKGTKTRAHSSKGTSLPGAHRSYRTHKGKDVHPPWVWCGTENDRRGRGVAGCRLRVAGMVIECGENFWPATETIPFFQDDQCGVISNDCS